MPTGIPRGRIWNKSGSRLKSKRLASLFRWRRYRCACGCFFVNDSSLLAVDRQSPVLQGQNQLDRHLARKLADGFRSCNKNRHPSYFSMVVSPHKSRWLLYGAMRADTKNGAGFHMPRHHFLTLMCNPEGFLVLTTLNMPRCH